jgi:hypothetical protein
MTPSSNQTKTAIPLTLIAIVAGLLAVGGALFWYLEREAGLPMQKPVLTQEAKAYVHYLKLSDVQMKATSSYLSQTVVEIEGKITNTGDRPVRDVELNCVFYDPYGQLVLRERVAIVRSRDGALNPGQTRNFRMPFDSIPESWNQTMPQLVIAQIVFG